MFQPDATELVRQGQQEIVVRERTRTEYMVCLPHQRTVGFEYSGLGLEQLGGIGHHVHAHRNLCAGIQVDALEMPACIDR